MDSRRRILDALRNAAPPDAPLPDEPLVGIRYPDPAAQLAESLAAVGGALQRVAPDDLPGAVAALAQRLGAARVASLVARVEGNVRLGDLADPHELEGIDLAVLPGAFAVSESGAVWVDTKPFAHRGVFVVAQHLALVVPAGAIVSELHQAYERLRFEGPGFGVFISGPSKTADIEQALVIGAHGARSCVVFLVG